MKLWYIALASILTAAISPACLAEDAAPAPAELGIEVCIERALGAADNRTLAELDTLLARADRDLAGSDSMPHLNVTPGVRIFSESGETEPVIGLDFGRRLLEVPQNRVRRRIADTRLEWAQHRKTRVQRQLTARVWHAYLACLRERHFLQWASRAEDVAQRVTTQWDAVTAQDLTIGKERRAAAAAAQQARRMRERADATHRQAQCALRALCGLAPQDEVRCRDLEPYAIPTLPLARCQAWALTHRSDLLGARMDCELSVQAIRLARMNRLPTPELGLGYGTRDSTSTEEGREEGYALLRLQIPVWDAGETAARVRKAEAQSLAAKADLLRMERDLAQTVAAGHLALEQALADYEAARSEPGPKEDFGKIEVQHKSGAVTDLEFERSRLRFMESEMEIRAKNLACYEQATRLLEEIEATRSEWSGGLAEKTEPGADGHAD